MRRKAQKTTDANAMGGMKDQILSVFGDQVNYGLTLDDLLFLEDRERRVMWLIDEIDDFTANAFIGQIFGYNCEDAGKVEASRQPVILFVNSRGGDVLAGMTILDAILTSKTPIYTVNIGIAYSMAFYIVACGKERFALPNATFLLHDGMNGGYDSSSKFRDRLRFTDELDIRLKKIILERTRITDADYEKNERREWYMFTQEALELGIIDKTASGMEDIIDLSKMHLRKK